MLSGCLGDQFWGKMLTRNSSFFSDIERKRFVLIATCFYRESEKIILLMQRIIFGGHIFKKRCNLLFLGVCAKNCETPGESSPVELSKMHLTIPEEQCGFMFFLKKLSAHCFLGFWVDKSAISPKIFSRFVKTAFFRVQRNVFDEKMFFFIDFIKLNSCSSYELKFFVVYAKSFRRGCKNCILQFRGEISRANIFWRFYT